MEPSRLAPRKLGKIIRSELLGALSHALDLTEGQPPGHCVRCSRIGSKSDGKSASLKRRSLNSITCYF